MTLDQRIDDAEKALHELNLGRRAVSISRNGKTLTFTPANRSDLQRYISDLKAQKAGHRRRPMRVIL